MRKQIAAALLAGSMLLTGGNALADGMERGSLKDVPVVPTWSGFYLGVGVGYGMVHGDNKYSDNTPFNQSWTNDGLAGGFGTVVLGFDRQFREHYVLGVFTEFDWASMEGHFRNDLPPATDDTFRLRDAYSIGARAGFLLTPTSLLYATGGYTWAWIKNNGYFDIFDEDTNTLFPGRNPRVQGPFVGVGMETQLGRNWSLRGEARYTMFDDIVTNSGTTALGVSFVDRMEANMLTARLAVTYKWNRDEVREVAPIK
jgi:outer membrane immunogenic protein